MKKPEARSQKPEEMQRHGAQVLGRVGLRLLLPTGFWLLATGLFLLPGCSDSKSNSSSSGDSGDAALRDPMHWRPDIQKADTQQQQPQPADSSRGVGTGSIKKDWDSFWNP